MARRKNLRIRLSKESVLTVDRSRMWKKRLAYILVANKVFKYPSGRTHILYIGTTRRGARRPAASAVEKAIMSMFGEVRGVKQIGIYLLNSQSRPNVKTWQKLESALLAVFRQRYWALPQENKKRGEYGNADDIQYFRRDNLEKILRVFEQPPKL